MDGSHVQIPSDIHNEATYFNSTKDGRGYNLLHLNALYDLESQLYLDAIIQDGRKEHESQALVEMADRSELTEPVILIADRGYEAYNNMAHIEQKGWKYLIRVKDKQGILSGLKLPDAPEFDAVFRYSLSKRLTNRIRREPQKYRWIPSKVHFDYIKDISDALYLISFRVVRFAVKEGLCETVITNLPANQFPPSLLRELYHKRWGIETSFRDLKYTLALTRFHSKKRPFIKQEIFSRMALYNFASMLRLHAVFTQPEGKHLYRINAAFAAHIARGVPAWPCSCGQSGALDREVPASCPAWSTKTEEYAREEPDQFSVPDDLRAFHLCFSRRKLCAFFMPSFLMYAFTKSPPRFFPEGGCVGGVYLNEIRLAAEGSNQIIFVIEGIISVLFSEVWLSFAACL